MYKILLMIKDNADNEIVESFRENALVHLEKASGQNILIGEIDGAKLNEDPFSKVCEIEFETKHEMDKVLASNDGKKFNRNMTNFFQYISIFFIDFGVK